MNKRTLNIKKGRSGNKENKWPQGKTYTSKNQNKR